MKKMTCKELGGACDLVFEADSFEEMAKLSQAHGMEMWKKQDADHMEAMQAMQALMKQPEMMQQWMADTKALFDSK